MFFHINLASKGNAKEESDHYWNEMLKWITKAEEDKIITSSDRKKAETCLSSMQNKIPFLFNRFHKECALNLKQKTTGCVEIKNRHLKDFGVDLCSSLTKLAKTGVLKIK